KHAQFCLREVGLMFHGVHARELVATLLQEFHQQLGGNVAIDGQGIAAIGLRKVFVEKAIEFPETAVFLPLLIIGILEISRRNDSLRVLEPSRLDDATALS